MSVIDKNETLLLEHDERLQKTLLYVFVFSQIMVFSPLPKDLMILLPLVTFIYVFLKNPLKYTFDRVLLILITLSIYLTICWLVFMSDFYLVNFLIALIFYSSFLFLFVVKPPNSLSKLRKETLDRVIGKIIVVEALVGILQVAWLNQGFDLSSGDYVQGTINVFSFINKENGFANIFFTINQVSLLTYYFLMANKKNYVILFLGIVSIILASCIHITLAIIVAIGCAMALINIIKVGKVLVAVLFFIGALSVLAPRNLASFSTYKDQILESRNLKVKSTFIGVPLIFNNTKSVFFGMGLGQYGSRSSLIMSGKYFYNKDTKKFRTPFGAVNQNENLKNNLLPLWIKATTDESYGMSVMNKPVYSILSLFMELGPIFFTLLFLVFIIYILKLRSKFFSATDKMGKRRYFYLIVVSIFVMGISFFENYLEIAQAIFPTLILILFFQKIREIK